MLLNIILISLLIVILIGAAGFLYKMNQLKRLGRMSASELIHEITKHHEDIKISIAIIKDGEITYQVYGENGKSLSTTEYDYEIGSISKTFVGLMLSKAIEEGKIDLHTSISEYLPLTQDKYYPTIERLITHTAGYKSHYFHKQMLSNYVHQSNDFYGIDKNEILRKVQKLTLSDKDYAFKYSNFGIAVIGLVLEQVYDKDFVTLMNEFIKADLNLKNTEVARGTGNLRGYWNWKKDDGYIPAGAMISTIEDMAEYLAYYMKKKDHYVCNTYAERKSIHANQWMYEKLNIRMDHIGMTWLIDEKHQVIWHNGGKSRFNSHIAFDKEKRNGVVVLGNTSPIKVVPMTVLGARLMSELELD